MAGATLGLPGLTPAFPVKVGQEARTGYSPPITMSTAFAFSLLLASNRVAAPKPQASQAGCVADKA